MPHFLAFKPLICPAARTYVQPVPSRCVNIRSTYRLRFPNPAFHTYYLVVPSHLVLQLLSLFCFPYQSLAMHMHPILIPGLDSASYPSPHLVRCPRQISLWTLCVCLPLLIGSHLLHTYTLHNTLSLPQTSINQHITICSPPASCAVHCSTPLFFFSHLTQLEVGGLARTGVYSSIRLE
jgi:hypothetical protein